MVPFFECTPRRLTIPSEFKHTLDHRFSDDFDFEQTVHVYLDNYGLLLAPPTAMALCRDRFCGLYVIDEENDVGKLQMFGFCSEQMTPGGH